MNGRPIVGKLFYQMQVDGKRDWSYLSSKYEPLRVYNACFVSMWIHNRRHLELNDIG